MASQSPEDDRPTREYSEAWETLNRLIREGGSWSGRETNCAYLNLGDGTFADVSRTTGLGFMDDGRAFATVDWDHDGDLDLWIVNRTAPQVRFMRNDIPGSARSVSFRLTGDRVNRDAIGTRVEVRAGGDRWVRELQAGGGFLSQSSKWLHFGVGGHERLDEVVVRWPDGSAQRFADIETGRRYRLTQGARSLEPVAVNGAREVFRLTPSTQRTIEPSEVANIGLTWRVGLPPVRMTDFEGEEYVLGEGGRPLLVNIWASWCPSCVQEFRQWTGAKDEIEGAGLTILALAVDEIEADAGNDAARAVAEQLGVWFPTGAATDELLLLFEVLQSALVDRSRRLPVPASFLIDGDGRLARIYKGRIEVDRLLRDVADLSLGGLDAARASLPFSGRWHEGPHFPGVLRISRRLMVQDAPTLANYYVAQALEFEGTVTDRTRQKMADSLAFIGNQMIVEGRPEEARVSLERAVGLDPSNAKAWYLLGRLYVTGGDFAGATGALETATGLEPELPSAWHLLGMAREGLGDRGGALPAYVRALEADPDLTEGWLSLGAFHLMGGDAGEAAIAFRRAVEGSPEKSLAWAGFGASLCSLGDREGGMEALEQALELDPSNARALSTLAACR